MCFLIHLKMGLLELVGAEREGCKKGSQDHIRGAGEYKRASQMALVVKIKNLPADTGDIRDAGSITG